MATISRKVFSSIEQQLAAFSDAKARNQPPPPPHLYTNLDDEQTAKQLAKKGTGAVTKRQIGRLKKWMGDLCMHICAIGDAMELYLAAISDLRPLGDSMWYESEYDSILFYIFFLPVCAYLGWQELSKG
jgi:hypothetical protein